MDHLQPLTPVQIDNSTACRILNSNVWQCCSRAIDMRFYWVQDCIKQGQFIVYWKPGAINLGDYFTKHHPPVHHRKIHETYLLPTLDSSKKLA